MNQCSVCGTWWTGVHSCPKLTPNLQYDVSPAANQLSELERIIRERNEARAELAKVTADYAVWRKVVTNTLKRASEQRESWSQIARAQARELTALRAAAQRVIYACDHGAAEPALEALAAALTDEPTEADHAE